MAGAMGWGQMLLLELTTLAMEITRVATMALKGPAVAMVAALRPCQAKELDWAAMR